MSSSSSQSEAYDCKIFQNVVEPTSNINAFLAEFAPASTPPPKCLDKQFRAKIYTGSGREPKMREQIVKGLKSVVRKFPPGKRPKFHDLSRHFIRAPFAMCDDGENAHKIDVCATLPELDGIPPLARWRNLALVFDIRSHADEDPMAKNSKEHEQCFLRLTSLAQNTMLAQGKLYAYIVGIYGRKARLYRFDRCGAVCSPLFNYTTEPRILHDFLWRFVHPKFDGCVVLGDDPTVKRGTRADRSLVQELAKQYDPAYTYTAETKKAIRRVTVTQDDGGKATYLVYKLIHTDPHLLSRASTVWEAFALNGNGEATGKRVVIKEAWQYTSMPSEITFYHDLQEAAAASAESGTKPSLSGIVRLEGCNDLGAREVETFARGTPRPGYRTMRCEGSRVHERSFVRMVFGTIGTPLYRFKSTYEVACALRDAIEGHRQAYQLGLIHRDISVGNVMMERKADGTVGGFIHDLDYAFSWKRFLAAAGLPVDLETWERYVREEYRRVTQEKTASAAEDAEWDRTMSHSASQTSRDTAESSAQEEAPEFDVNPALQKEQKRKTGTTPYMAMEVLDNDQNRDVHDARHDLESFLWLFIWLVMRQVSHTLDHCTACHYNVVFESEAYGNWPKHRWIFLEKRPIMVVGNEPLTKLLESFRQLCRTNHRSKDNELNARWMTHEDVLNIFDEALEDPDQWPKADNIQQEPPMEFAYSGRWRQSDGTAASTVTNHSIPEQNLPPVPAQAEEEVLPQPDPAPAADAEPQRNSASDGGNADAAATLAEEEASVRETTRPLHAMETRARAAARTRAALAAGAGEAQQQRRSRPGQAQKRRHGQEDGAEGDGSGTSRPSKRPRTAGPSRRAREPPRRTRRL
ncbi:hypothetical protein FOMPIDRAFT_1049643 [Fomitopsis schrenkii]|uniref:Fungal-type protein kinase domain-containing protein n=1 Tax=Fomitopsis schrenkii TaxID=2126942 RepID=S8E7F4_FOMSC|nr:hypothetical protein FOMPIDRAFT_1049643 [Fomitopsis schrenkii]